MKTALPSLRTREERNRLIEQYLPLVHHIVGRLTVSLPPNLDRDDLFGSGVLGLMHAAEAWDPGKGASFKTFAYTAVRGAILDELRRQDPLSRSVRERLRRLETAHRELASRNGRPPTREELASELSCDLEELDQDLVHLHTSQTLSIDDGIDEESNLGETIPDEGVAPIQDLEKKESLELLTSEIAKLPPQSCQVVILYYHEGLLLKEIGAVLGVSESRVCQILSKALAQLKLALDA